MTTMVTDAYASLKALVLRRFKGQSSGQVTLAKLEDNPEAWEPALKAELERAGAKDDRDLVEAAQRLLAMLDAAGSRSGRHQVDVRGGQGVQIGDHGTQSNIFNAPPST